MNNNYDPEQHGESVLLESLGTPKKTSHMEKQYGMFPPAFNKLREVLYEEHHDLWQVVGGMMVHNHDYLFAHMNGVLDTICTPELGIELCCERWLRALERRPKTYRRG